ncbi:hypothetical protein SAMN05216188_101971 [Lentzea xinjiangensis]|uniref:Uncharacterized protein n=1 Tax=Lentzea xinjiangensis TaxID=402600 RepID=A0A1H9BX89_9PSEU|nr:hypothetical protein [Lentzea xinjiangensis]SEP93550.1 hypothetical protein SAMN05216188_101971 [Lentzea xinjiangensis]
MRSEEDGVRLLGSLRAVEVPASDGVSVAKAIRAGKRTRSLRVAAAGVVVLLVAGVLPLLLRPSAPPVAASTFDPLVRTIGLGPVPGLRQETLTTGRTSQSIWLRPVGSGDQAARVSVFAAGTMRPLPGEPAQEVNGRRAVWTGTYLAFEWEPGAWATVSVEGFPDDRERERQIARSLTFDEHVRVRVPYTVETSWQLHSVHDTGGDVELVFTNDVRLKLRGGVGFAQGPAPREELEALERSVRPADPPVTDPFR